MVEYLNTSQGSFRRIRQILAERIQPVVLWAGAGLSSPANLPSWAKLKKHLISELDEKAETFGVESEQRGQLLQVADRIENEEDLWVAFQMLQSALGDATYDAAIRHQCSPKVTNHNYWIYERFWRLGIKGIITLNIDRLASNAWPNRENTRFEEIDKRSLGGFPNVLRSGHEFVFNAHGIVTDKTTWVFTHDDLRKLLESEIYKTFLDTLFINTTVLFAGISADDIAAGGHLVRLIDRLNADLGTHFWLTHRTDTAAEKFSNSTGLEIIRYRVTEDGSHSPGLEKFFEEIGSFVPEEEQAVPVTTSLVNESTDIPTANDLASLDPEEIRTHLSSYARHIVKEGERAANQNYQEFLKTFKRPIHNAWFVDITPPENTFFGYQVVSEIGAGAFSNVYEAVSQNGEKFALKLFRKELLFNQNLLDAFRRGVSSMKVLAKNKLPGMVRISEATELPLAIFMEFVDGETFERGIESKQIEPWDDGLNILVSAAKIIHSGHLLPQSVLHRDIRPSNIMVRNFYDPKTPNEVLVLDFDLSWHQGAYELTLTEHAQGSLGYLAPEQIRKIPKISARHTAVDVYGFCALTFFVFAGFHPYQGMFQHQDFPNQLAKSIKPPPSGSAVCLKTRVQRLILKGVQERQSDRIDFSQLIYELELLRTAHLDLTAVNDPNFWAEEIIACTTSSRDYIADPQTGGFVRQFASGMILKMEGNLLADRIHGSLNYTEDGTQERKKVIKYISSKGTQIVAKLRKVGFETASNPDTWYHSISLEFEIEVSLVKLKKDEIGTTLQEVSAILAFD